MENKNERINAETNPEKFKVGDLVSVASSVGCCLTMRIVKINRKTISVTHGGNVIDREYKFLVHPVGSCRSCSSHPDTMYY